ncbi:MAG TPA: F420-0--gamma-glutamyl ligase [Firmicutes bacterium]|nr:F420-0--gamma-glutamyl ligase [Bacillota bacterium]
MVRTIGTVAIGIRAPIVQEGDDVVAVIVDSVLRFVQRENFCLQDRAVIGITESLVARAQGNYVSIQDVALDIKDKFSGDMAVVFPILSRNRFAPILKGIARSERKIYLFLSYPADEMGNSLMDMDIMDQAGLNPYTDVLTEDRYRKIFGDHVRHPFTGIDYVRMYKELAVNDNIVIYFANDPRVALDFSPEVLVANVHARERTKRILKRAGATVVRGLDDILTKPVNGSGYSPDFGLLGSNLATDNTIKLFPRDCQRIVDAVQAVLKDKTGKHVEVMIYGDGAFKDPQGKIWELADPVVSPGYTKGLEGTPHEVKLKYIADNELSRLGHEQVNEAIKLRLREKKTGTVEAVESLGTTPRRLTDLLGSLCDLTSGSGDKGTPIVLVQGYFDDYATE